MRSAILAEIPDELAQQWLQYVRDFDVAHPGCHFNIIAVAPDMTVADLMRATEISPPFQHRGVVPPGGREE